VASIVDRLARLEGRKRPLAKLPPPSHTLTRLLADLNRYRATLDAADREADQSGRLEFSEPPAPPEPPALSIQERRAELKRSEEFLEFLEHERDRMPADTPGHASAANAARLWAEEIELQRLAIGSEEENSDEETAVRVDE
jgi:hypothetical protein